MAEGLTVKLNFNCRCNGPMPIEIALADDAKLAMTCIELCPPSREWSVVPELCVRPNVVGTGDRAFPGVSFTAKVVRTPFYYLIYSAAPFGMFSLLAVLTGATRSVSELALRSQLALMLVLTASTYRIALACKDPNGSPPELDGTPCGWQVPHRHLGSDT